MKFLFCVLLVVGYLAGVPCISVAQTGGLAQHTNAIAIIDQQNVELETTSSLIATDLDTYALRSLREQVLQIQSLTAAALAGLEPEITALDEKLAQLGEPAQGEDADIDEQRNQLRAQRAELDSAMKRGRLLSTKAGVMLETVNRALSDEFNRSTFERIESPLSSGFWGRVANSIGDDIDRIARVLNRPFAPGDGVSIALSAFSLAGVLLLIGPARRRLETLGYNFAKHHAPGMRIRRSGLAIWFTTVGTVTAILAFTLLAQALRWLGFFGTDVGGALLSTFVGTASFAAFVVALGRALLLTDRGSWRLPPVDDVIAQAMRHYPTIAAAILAFGVALVEINRLAGVSPQGNVLSNLVIALCYVGLIAAVLKTGHALRARPSSEGGDDRGMVSAPWLFAAAMVLRLALIASVLAILIGYVNLALFIGRQLVWVAIVSSAAYLFVLAIDDFARTICSSEGVIVHYLQASFRIRPSTVRQAGVIGSAITRVAVIFVAVALMFAPIGPGTGSLLSGIGNVKSISVAGITVEPASVLRALIALALALAAVRFVLKWLEDTYLPATELDSGARNSAVTIVKYAGFILAGLWTMNTLGIGVERIALVVSALSVGIGFGLQAITQNFISGLILLAERPLKIGDTIRVGADEGDVKKISVRATEIQIGDRSTLIVPNSELITKTIRNMTPLDPVGRLEISFSVPIDVDPKEIREHVLDIYSQHAGVLDEPRPTILIESIADGRINFKSFAFVALPRSAASTKSALLFALLERFRLSGIPLQTS